ncbi:hypothetical protein GUJ93_ZPchr0004g40048 [Zizania palustris]|uniref:Uncharacterized protein n=1 Tax=Zizania palustris TaxID=103762 RepID=A0A8J5W034_ZIZPA|nr:hypothetical protein GUJ93_ZPchr0004g40048 [Zizania palustris]
MGPLRPPRTSASALTASRRRQHQARPHGSGGGTTTTAAAATDAAYVALRHRPSVPSRLPPPPSSTGAPGSPACRPSSCSGDSSRGRRHTAMITFHGIVQNNSQTSNPTYLWCHDNQADSSTHWESGTSTWPWRLTLTNHALHFEDIDVDLAYNKAVWYDLSRDLKQNIKLHLFDKAAMYKSSSTELVFFEFPQFKGHTRRDYWFIRKYKLLNFQKAAALSVATLGILRYRTVKEGFNILPAHFKAILAFNLEENLPKGDKVLEALYGQLQTCSLLKAAQMN